MFNIVNFKNVIPSGISYGGHSGSKMGIIYNGEKWFLKYPRLTSCVSEYLGSHIYNSIGANAHETILGVSNGKVVVACKDFLNSNEVILDYLSIKNYYDEEIERKIESLSSSKNVHGTDLDEVNIIMNNNEYFKKVPKLKDIFWDMFIIDSLINNNDRNENNWGLVLNRENGNLRISPVFDNGASFFNKKDDEGVDELLNNDMKFLQVVYDSSICSFIKDSKIINPLKYIESMSDSECNNALIRIFPKIDLNKIKDIIYSVPCEYENIRVLSDKQKELYFKSVVYKYEKIFKPVYDKIKSS